MAGSNFTMSDLAALILQADKQFAAGKRTKQTPYYQSPLTNKERAVFRASVQGANVTSKAVAKKLGLAEQTVNNHLSSIYSKLGVKTHLQLVLHYRGELPDKSR